MISMVRHGDGVTRIIRSLRAWLRRADCHVHKKTRMLAGGSPCHGTSDPSGEPFVK